MALRKSSSFLTKQDVLENKERRGVSDEDLYFEMEYPEGKRSRTGTIESDTTSNSSKSVESLRSDTKDSPYTEERRESKMGPILERPKSLNFASKFKRDIWYGSLPRTTQQQIPKFSFNNFSVPNTPVDFWEKENNLTRGKDMNSSTSSVEDASETSKKKTRSRLSLNLGVFDGSPSPCSPARSSRIIPQFLRTSFNRLITKEKCKTPDPLPVTMSLPFLGKVFSPEQNVKDDQNNHGFTNDQIDEVTPPSSPTTKLFVEESLAKGLPIIPFNYPTFVIVEKKRTQSRSRNPWSHSQAEHVKTGKIVESTRNHLSFSEPTSRKISNINQQESSEFLLEEKSLDKLLGQAKKEMEEEKNLRKSSSVRGYAANNSRALSRRRSSVSEYVGMSYDIYNTSYPIPDHSLSYNYMGQKTRSSPGAKEDYLDMTCGREGDNI